MANKAPNAKDLANLAMAVAATNGGAPLMIAKKSMKVLHDMGLVEFNDEIKNGDTVACRATQAGVEYSAKNGAPTGASTEVTPQPDAVPVFALEDNIPIPAVKRGGRSSGPSRYPFEIMNVNQSFFMPKTDENPKPGKRVAAAVSNASKKLAPKKFKVVSIPEGARVWRIV